MLSCLRIRDLAIIDELELELGPGLNVLTGETGAGKSILVSALELVLGGKGRPELVRSGAKDGEVEALFSVQGDARLARSLAELELDAVGEGEEAELVVRRVLSASGRTRGFLNGRLVPQQVLARLTRGLTDISSQHEHHTLSDPSTHLGYLDAFAHAGSLRERLARAYQELRQAAALLRDCEARGQDREARESFLQAQLQEIDDAELRAGRDGALDEEQELEQRCRRLRSVEALLRLTGQAAELLYERDDSVVDGLAQAARNLGEAAELDPQLAPLAAQLEALRGQLADAARELGRHVRAVRPDPDALQRAEERLYQLAKLKRRYGGSLEAVLAHRGECQAELDALSRYDETSEALQLALARSLQAAEALARALSSERRLAAGRLGAAISQELDSLGMGGARVVVSLRSLGLPGAPAAGTVSPGLPRALSGEATEFLIDGVPLSSDGLERAEFLIAPNRGEEARSLHRVASGGELSRAMLAIKCVLADLGPAGMYVFDEIDTGVGGGMAEIIGRKIRSVARHRQVLCITHLPQIAVFADQHFKVEKFVRDERTLSRVRRLSGREQREEIARMLGGLNITAKTRAAARELLHQARRVA
ncbi:MAG TPA: DNA repair protein RecN [Polyangiaceae bacterium]|nr:DNA repair protein RecN [Polyangiaceae bacterium]